MGTSRLSVGCVIALVAAISCNGAFAAKRQSSQPAAKKRVVCWVEEDGRKSCGDAVPAKYSSRERTILDEKGRVVRVIPAALTAEQLAAKEAAAKEAEVAKAAAEKQDAYDRALTATYFRPQDLAALRDDRLATLDTSIEVTGEAVKRDEASLEGLRKRLPAPDSKDKAPSALLNKIANFETSLADNRRALTEMRQKRDALCTTFDRDIRRFQEMKGGVVSFHSPCPAPGTLKTAGGPKLDMDSARAFFARVVDMERDYDIALVELYTPKAVIRRLPAKAGAKEETRNLAQHRKILDKELPAAKLALEIQTYSKLKFEDLGDGHARISGTRTSSLKPDAPAAFSLLIRPADDSWKIVEDSLGVAPAPK